MVLFSKKIDKSPNFFDPKLTRSKNFQTELTRSLGIFQAFAILVFCEQFLLTAKKQDCLHIEGYDFEI